MAGENDVEAYIGKLSGIEDTTDGTDTNVVNGGDNEDTGDGQQPTTVDESADGSAAQVEGANPKGLGKEAPPAKEGGQQPQEGQQNAAKQQLRPLGDGVFADGKGNITDQNGRVIARSGVEARLYQTNRRQQAQLAERDRQIQTMTQQFQGLRSLAEGIRSSGLDTESVSKAINFAKRVNSGDLLGVTKDVVAMALAAGYNVTDVLGKEVGDNIDMRGVRQMIDERLAPLTQREEALNQRAQADRQVRQAYDRFVAENDFAELHGAEIAKLCQQRGINPQAAYNQLLQFASVNGLDFSRPLGPQIEELMSAPQRQQQNGNGRQQKPMPNGAATRSGGVQVPVVQASADDDWNSIISEVQRTVGLS